ncbi:Protein FAR1-RELATED SEQUENCE like [Actinidia chinensis var. chinensis]|uniref:Protein FAR1-RELATED SEQUENCE like n=1 Tax=Actinidia chinensis var. chinensis TaxID=1590841 RepID=A0A2R6S1M2_ACTCC|nr:Protein FAR1-RELATED SEQUENCE like [Actinidia chinensis var. chinensis]
MEIEDMDLEENMNVDAVLEPKVGTIFNSENEAKEYYSTYAKAKGFGSVVKASKKRDDGVKAYVIYTCHRSGKPRTTALNPVKSHPTSKVDCKAHMNISLQVDGKWMLNSIELNHNHELDLKKAKYLKVLSDSPTTIAKGN